MDCIHVRSDRALPGCSLQHVCQRTYMLQYQASYHDLSWDFLKYVLIQEGHVRAMCYWNAYYFVESGTAFQFGNDRNDRNDSSSNQASYITQPSTFFYPTHSVTLTKQNAIAAGDHE